MSPMSPIRTLADIQNATRVESDKRGRPLIVIDCPPDVDSMLAFGANDNPMWPSHKSSRKTDETWTGTASYDAAGELLRCGWKEGTAKIADITKKITPRKVIGLKHKTVYRGTVAPGLMSRPNIPAVISGVPNQFITAKPTAEVKHGAKIIRIGVNMFVSSGVEHAIIERRGAAIMSVLHILERFGKTVDLTIMYAGSSNYGQPSSHAILRWHVKPAGRHINPDQLAFALIHPSSFRRVGFAMIEHIPQPYAATYPSYMSPTPTAGYSDEPSRYDIFIEAGSVADAEYATPQAAESWVRKQLTAQGIDCGE